MREKIGAEQGIIPGDQTIEGKLQSVRGASKNERHAKIAEFKHALVEYQVSWGTITKELIAVIQDDPDITQQEFMEQFYRLAESRSMYSHPAQHLADGKVDLNSETRIVERTFEHYHQKHGVMKDLRKQYPDDALLFEHFFGSQPKGKIEIIEGLSHLHVRCWDPADYAAVFIYPGDDNKRIAELSGGVMQQDYIRGISITAAKNTEEAKIHPRLAAD